LIVVPYIVDIEFQIEMTFVYSRSEMRPARFVLYNMDAVDRATALLSLQAALEAQEYEQHKNELVDEVVALGLKGASVVASLTQMKFISAKEVCQLWN
jgi:hypothetical protein